MDSNLSGHTLRVHSDTGGNYLTEGLLSRLTNEWRAEIEDRSSKIVFGNTRNAQVSGHYSLIRSLSVRHGTTHRIQKEDEGTRHRVTCDPDGV